MYVCMGGYMLRQDTIAKADMQSVLGISADDDLYEVGGYMLRLALADSSTACMYVCILF
jgi:hypothetical protein